MLRRLAASLVLACLALAGCSKPYAVPEITLLGYSDNEQLTGFTGLADYLGTGGMHVVWVHGMCSHDRRWADDRHAALRAQLPADMVWRETTDEDDRPGVVSFEGASASALVTVDYLIWSGFTAAAKAGLAAADPNDGPDPQRASINRALRTTLLNDCLGDGVAYVGRAAPGQPPTVGDAIRAWMRTTVCASLGGTMLGQQCDFPSAPPSRPTVLVAESLGSKLLFDAVRSLWDRADASREAELNEALSAVQTVVLISNQLPLLDLAQAEASSGAGVGPPAPPGVDSGVNEFLGILVGARNAPLRVGLAPFAPPPPLQVVTFSDPNDLLSYRLTPESLDVGGVRVASILVSNAPTYLGMLERPDSAHCGYEWNEYVIGTILRGYRGTPLSVPIPNPSRSCSDGE
jgi:hypothetical protein